MALKYVGGGAYIHGVPARDLSDDEEAKFGKLIAEQEKLTGATLYTRIAKPKQASEKGEGGK